jgi:hypothetical protein
VHVDELNLHYTSPKKSKEFSLLVSVTCGRRIKRDLKYKGDLAHHKETCSHEMHKKYGQWLGTRTLFPNSHCQPPGQQGLHQSNCREMNLGKPEGAWKWSIPRSSRKEHNHADTLTLAL